MHGSITVLCPYYERENQTTIFCEYCGLSGEEAQCCFAHCFRSQAEKAAYQKAHCGKYPNMGCRWAEKLDREYERREKKKWEGKKRKRKKS